MKVLGLSFGRKDQNCDICVKQALLGAQAAGAEGDFQVHGVEEHDLRPGRSTPTRKS